MKINSTLFFLLLTLSAFTQQWTSTSLSPLPERVSNNAVCEGFIDGTPYVYSFAGIDSTKTSAGIHLRSYRYNTAADSWETIPSLPDTLGKIAASANRIGDIIYIIGGYHVFPTGSEISSDKVHRYHIPSNTYLDDGAPIPVPIDDQVQVVYKDSLIFVVSGWSNTQNVFDVQIYDPVNDLWSIGTPITWMEQPVFGGAGAILGDTIYFYGGARNGDFSISNVLRKGAINPNNPSEITWSTEFLSSSIRAYRPTATISGNAVFFIGGSDQTYNYDGLAYSNGQGVEPNNRSFYYLPQNASFEADETVSLPMDLRGIADINDDVKYLAGGMIAGQEVTNQLLRLDWNGLPTSTRNIIEQKPQLSLFPNPVTNKTTIEISDINLPESFIIRLSSELGNVVRYFKLSASQLELDLSNLPNGVYFLSIPAHPQLIPQKLLKL